MALIDSVRTKLRITTTALDSEIAEEINAAKSELIRSGFTAEVVNAEGDLVTEAIKAYVCARMTSDKTMIEGFEESFRYQQDNLRKSTEVS